MKVKKVPMRTCVVSRVSKPKQDLIRVVKNKNNEVSIDITGKAPGRGAYLTLQKDIILKAIKSKVLDRKLEVEIPTKIYDDLLELIR